MSRSFYAPLVAVLAVIASCSLAPAEDKPKSSPDQQQVMDAYMKASQPGAEHETLKRLAGDWNAEVKSFNPDGSPGTTTTGLMHCEMILGGRYLQLNYSGEMDMGNGKVPFHGMGLAGYDNAKKKFVNIWIDEMSTSVMHTEGTKDGNVMTLEGTCTDPMSGQPMNVKEVTTDIDATHHKYELWMAGADGKMMKMLEITYTKKA